MIHRLAALMPCAALLLGAPLPLLAAPLNFGDHLDCHKVKNDPAGRGKFSIDLTTNQFGLEEGCIVKMPAKIACMPSKKENVQPPPPGAPAGPNLIFTAYVCYKVKCPKRETDIALRDQLGGLRTLTLGEAKLVCAPAALQ